MKFFEVVLVDLSLVEFRQVANFVPFPFSYSNNQNMKFETFVFFYFFENQKGYLMEIDVL